MTEVSCSSVSSPRAIKFSPNRPPSTRWRSNASLMSERVTRPIPTSNPPKLISLPWLASKAVWHPQLAHIAADDLARLSVLVLNKMQFEPEARQRQRRASALAHSDDSSPPSVMPGLDPRLS